MARLTTTCWRLALPLALWLSAGCCQIRVPAIDPTGERIFLPAPSYTTLNAPNVGSKHSSSPAKPHRLDLTGHAPLHTWLPCWPKPAFQAPPPPPPCDENGMPPPEPEVCQEPDVEPPSGPRWSDGHQPGVKFGRLVLTPARMVAPVGSEVVLMAGLCDPAGYFVVKQPIEWIMSQESVGHLVNVGEPGYGIAPPMFNRGSRKIGSNYAVGTTVSKTAVFTRGTAATDDDFTVRRGQSWVSVTSPTEGVTHLTVWAPNAKAWDLRRQTATIHWVDAQWTLPAPAIVSAGQRQLLTTRVTRTSGAPGQGWLVRYEIVSGPPAGFGVNGPTVVEVPVDAQGNAVAELVPQSDAPGISKILVQITRAGQASGEPARIVIGQGYTTVAWSAAGLQVDVTGPAQTGVGDVLTYRVEVANPGDLPARNVVLRDVPPPLLEYLNSSPSGQPMGDHVQWNLGDLGPRQARVVTVNVRARDNGDFRYCFRALADGGLQAEGCAQSRVFTSALAVRMVGPETVEVGQTATFQIEVQNTGRTALSNVTLIDRFDAGLQHSEGQTSPIERLLGELQAGQSIEDLAVTFVVTAAGRHCHTLEVVADGGHRAATRGCVLAIETPKPPVLPKLEVQKSGPARMQVGEAGLFQIQVRNTGEVPATNVRIIDRYDPALTPLDATESAVRTDGNRGVAWSLRDIAPGATVIREVRCQAVAAAEQASSQVTISSEQGVTATDETTTTIVPAPAPDPMPPDEPAPGNDDEPAAVTGELQARVVALDNPVRVGQPTRFLITLRNTRNVSDRNVTVTAILPESVQVQRVTGPMVRHRQVGNQIRWEPVQEIREGEDLRPPFEIELVPSQAGTLTVRVRIESTRLRQPLEVTGSVDVNQP